MNDRKGDFVDALLLGHFKRASYATAILPLHTDNMGRDRLILVCFAHINNKTVKIKIKRFDLPVEGIDSRIVILSSVFRTHSMNNKAGRQGESR